MDYRVFNVLTDVNACDCVRGCTDTVKESAVKVDSGRKIPFRTGESNLRRRRADPKLSLPTELHPHPQCSILRKTNADVGERIGMYMS